MKYWGINELNVSPDNSVRIKSGRNVNINKGDKVIFFSRIASKVRFLGYGTIEYRKVEEVKNKYLFTGIITEVVEIKAEYDLEDFTYSLQKIYRYKKPHTHFERTYISLSKYDYNAIINGLIYWSRTSFGIFLNEITNNKFNKFIDKLAMKYPDLLLSEAGFSTLWIELKEFINEEFIFTSTILNSIKELSSNLEDSIQGDFKYDKIKLSSDEQSHVIDSISEQEKRFSNFNKSLIYNKNDIFNLIDEKIEIENEYKKTFEDAFRGSLWPMIRVQI